MIQSDERNRPVNQSNTISITDDRETVTKSDIHMNGVQIEVMHTIKGLTTFSLVLSHLLA